MVKHDQLPLIQYEARMLLFGPITAPIYRRGRCLAEIDFTIVYPFAPGNGFSAMETAASMASATRGSFNVAAFGNRTKRFWLPLPCRIPCGSGTSAPR